MKSFTIENETNNITVHGSAKEAEAVPNSERFASEAGLAKIAANWQLSRLVGIWNGLPGETPVKKFKDRATAVSRIWKAIQNLGQLASASVPEYDAHETGQAETVSGEVAEAPVTTTVAAQAPDVASAEPAPKRKATRPKEAPVAAGAKDTGAPREGSKTSQVIAMLKRQDGTTLEEIMTRMRWQKHTTRAMLSAGGSLTKMHGLVVTSEKVGEQRRYYIKV